MVPATDLDINSSHHGLDIGVVFNIVRGINIAIRNLASYPKDHPQVMQSFQRVDNVIQGLFESQSQLTLGIAKNTIMVGSKFLDRKNTVFRTFAQTLFDHGIVALTLTRGLRLNELIDFSGIITQKCNDISEQGGITALLLKAHVRHIRVQLIDYSMFQTCDELVPHEKDEEDLRSSLFWWRFIKGIFEETLEPQGKSFEDFEDIDPEMLAAMLNDTYSVQNLGAFDGLDFPVLQDMKREHFRQLAEDDISQKRLSNFVKSLNDELRQRFMKRFFTVLSDDDDVADSVLPCFSDDIILDALEKHTTERRYIPPNILDILKKLSKRLKNKDTAGIRGFLEDYSREKLTKKFNVIFKEDEFDRFVPLDYQKVLHDVIKADNLSVDELSDVEQLRKTITDESLDINLTSIITVIVASQSYDQISDPLKQSIRDHCTQVVRSGDFQVVLNLLKTIREKTVQSPNSQQGSWKIFTELFKDTKFIEEVLDAPVRWGKEKYSFIIELIKEVGPLFVDPLLDRLAEEGNRTRRQFYLDLLISLGLVVRDPAIKRLKDDRWYVLRNVITILRKLDDPSIVKFLHHLTDHPHPRVRQELLQTFIKYHDPIADRLLLEEMDSQDSSRCLRAIMMAGNSRSEEVYQRLLGILGKRWLTKNNLEMKKATVQTLADRRDPAVLPLFQSILRSHPLFFRKHAKLLKIEIIESLGKYSAQEASVMLNYIANSRSDELGDRAAMILKTAKVWGV